MGCFGKSCSRKRKWLGARVRRENTDRFRLKRFSNLLIFCIATAFVVSPFAGLQHTLLSIFYSEVRAETFESSSFRAIVGHPIKIVIYSSFTQAEKDALAKALRDTDPGGVFDRNPLTTDKYEMDSVAFFIDGWNSISELPDREIWGPVYEKVRDTDPRTLSTSLPARDGARHMRIIFYDMSKLKNKSKACFAKDLLVDFTLLHEPYPNVLSTCPDVGR